MSHAQPPSNEEQSASGPPERAERLAAVSIALSIAGVVLMPILTLPLGSKHVTAFVLPPWVPAAAISVVAAVFATAIGLAVRSQRIAGHPVRRALLWAVVGLCAWLLMLFGAFIFRGFGQPYEATSLYSQQLVGSPATRERPLPFGTAVEVSALGTRQPVMVVTPGKPLTITQEAVASGAPRPDDDYIAVPLTIEIVDASAAGRGVTLPDRFWLTHDLPRWPVELNIPGLAALDDLDLGEAGVHHVYDFYDTSDFEPGQGAYKWQLLGGGPDGAVWGVSIEDFIPRATSADYGAWVTLQSSVTGKEVGRVTVHAPEDVTEAVAAASLPDPENGAFFACWIEIEVDRSALTDPDAAIPLPELIFDPPRNTRLDSPPFPPDGPVPGYPTAEETSGTQVASAFAYYRMFDIPPEVVDEGTCVIFLGGIGTGLDYTVEFGPQ